MAQWHLDEIENSLNGIGWTVIERLEGNENQNFIGRWIIKRASERILDFDGIFDSMGNTIKNPSLFKAYACQITETDISLYFYKRGQKWDENLERFINLINDLK